MALSPAPLFKQYVQLQSLPPSPVHGLIAYVFWTSLEQKKRRERCHFKVSQGMDRTLPHVSNIAEEKSLGNVEDSHKDL